MDASGIASAIAGLDITRVVDENPTDVKDYGLDAPGVEVAFKSNGGKPSGKAAPRKEDSNRRQRLRPQGR